MGNAQRKQQSDLLAGMQKSLSLEWIPVSELTVCAEYQRSIKLETVRKIVSNFNPMAFGCVVVGRRNNGSCWVVDGFQRITARKKMGYENQLVPCVVFDSKGLKHEAEIFDVINGNRTQPGAADIYRSARAQRKPWAAEIDAVLESLGMELVIDPTSHNSSKGVWGRIGCIGRLIWVYKNGGGDVDGRGASHLRRVLQIIDGVWKGQKNALTNDIIGGVSILIRKAEVDDSLLISRLKTKLTTIRILNIEVRQFDDPAFKAKPGSGGQASRYAAVMLVEGYNKDVKKYRANKWWDSHSCEKECD